MKKMKKMSLVTKELLTNGLVWLSTIIAGICYGLIPNSEVTLIVFELVVSLSVIALLIEKNSQDFEVWDELAKEHNAEARRITFKCIGIFLVIGVLFMNIFEISFTIYSWHLFIFVGLINLVRTSVFIILEKRGMSDGV